METEDRVSPGWRALAVGVLLLPPLACSGHPARRHPPLPGAAAVLPGTAARRLPRADGLGGPGPAHRAADVPLLPALKPQEWSPASQWGWRVMEARARRRGAQRVAAVGDVLP